MKFLDSDRLLAEVVLEPVQGSRFQPTGFPSLGPAEFTFTSENGDDVDCLLVESAQSMANRFDKVCWDSAKLALVDVLKGMPLLTVNNEDGSFLTNSLLEAHRMNSTYILESDNNKFTKLLEDELDTKKDNHLLNIPKFVQFAFKHDPNSILHGVFISRKIARGRYKLTRSLSSFIEAENVGSAVSGGVKFDRIDPKGGDVGSSGQKGNILYGRTEYVAKTIKAYFNIDLSLIRSYGLSDTANEFLFTLALWKIRCLLEKGLRLRTACDLKIKNDLVVTYPKSLAIPNLDSLSHDLKKLIEKCKDEGLFEEPLILQYKKSKKSIEDKKDER